MPNSMSRINHPKVVLLGQFPPTLGGICTNIQNLLTSPLKEKYTFVLFQVGSTKYGTRGYFNESIFFKLWNAVKKLFYYVIYLSNNHPNIVHINTSLKPYSFRRDFSFLFVTKLFRVKVLLHIHGGVLDEFLERNLFLIRLLIKKLLEMPDQIIVLSSVQKETFQKYHIQRKVSVVPNMLDAGEFDQNENRKQKFSIPPGHIVILFVASIFFKEKGVWEALEAISLIVKNYRNALLILVGGDREEYAMKKYCLEKKLQDYVLFTGHLLRKDVIEIFRASNIFILPSYNEGFPLVILEAMAAGLPIVATPVGAIPEIIENGVNGFLIPPKDPLKLAEKIAFLIENKSLRESMAKNNILKVKEKYDLRPVSKVFDEIYQNLISY